MTLRARRLASALVVAIGGAALCLALDHYWWSKQTIASGGPFESALGDLLLVAIPFYALALLIALTRIRVLAAVLGAAAIVALTVYEYNWANTTDSSTAGLAFVGAIQVGVPIAFAAWGLDRLAVRVGRHRKRSQRHAQSSASE